MKEHKMFFGELIYHIRKKFGDKNLFLTFMAVHTDNDMHGKRNTISTFGHDNMNDITEWIALMRAKQISGSVEAISIIVRVFLKDKIETRTVEGKYIKIPKKELYHFLAIKDMILSFDKNETMQNQCTDFNTKKMLLDEPGILYKSSEEILNEIVKCK